MNERKKSRQDELPCRIKKILDERYADPNLSLDMLAEELGMSATYLGRVFKQHTLQTILGYIQEVRMSRVRELLLHTDAPVGEIAERAGFSNSPYFFKAFKKYNGVTPAEYRRTGRNRTDEDGVEAGIAAE
ncbi:Bifunctional transcriptional activator/DNA repair enzyme AdaA [compost metagenome]